MAASRPHARCACSLLIKCEKQCILALFEFLHLHIRAQLHAPLPARCAPGVNYTSLLHDNTPFCFIYTNIVLTIAAYSQQFIAA